MDAEWRKSPGEIPLRRGAPISPCVGRACSPQSTKLSPPVLVLETFGHQSKWEKSVGVNSVKCAIYPWAINPLPDALVQYLAEHALGSCPKFVGFKRTQNLKFLCNRPTFLSNALCPPTCPNPNKEPHPFQT